MKMAISSSIKRSKQPYQNIHFGKVILTLILSLAMIFSNFNVAEASNVKTITVTFEESTTRNRNKTITIPNLRNVVSVETNTGNVTHSISGDNITLNVGNGVVTRKVQTGGSPADSKYVEGQTSKNYNSGGYTGELESYVYSGSYTPEESKKVTEIGYTSVIEDIRSIPYNKDGFTGTLYATAIVPPHSNHEAASDKSKQFPYYYTGTVFRPAVDTRVYRYRGPVYKPDTRTYTDYYSYTVTIEYIDNSNPEIELSLPIQNSYFGKENIV